MRALTLTAIKAPLELQQRPDPTPASGEVVVRLKSAALNRRDYWITQGQYPGIQPPVVLGSDGAGVVEQTGAELGDSQGDRGADGRSSPARGSRGGMELVNQWQGREVVINPGLDWGGDPRAQSPSFSILGLPRDGTFADRVVVPASQLHERPTHLDWRQAAALPLGGVTAYRAVFTQGGVQPGETVLITGIGGGVATFALQFAVAAGATVWVTSSSDEKIDRAVQLGAAGGVKYQEDGWHKQLAEQAGPANLIVDSAGGPGYNSLIGLAAHGGRIVSYGATTGAPEKLDLFKVFWKQLRLQGTTMGSPDDFDAMLKLISQHRIAPIVDQIRPLAEGNEAIAEMQSSPQFGKIVLDIDP